MDIVKKDIGGNAEAEVVLYQPDSSIHIEVLVEGETVWLTQQQIADLFGTKRPAITKHLSNIFNSGELDKDSVSSILEHTAADGKTYKTLFYNLDAILSVGYRVNSINATSFRRWASTVLKQYLLGQKMSVFVLFPKDEWQHADEKTRLDSDDYFYPQMSDRCYTDFL